MVSVVITIDGLRPMEIRIREKESLTIGAMKKAIPIESTVNRWGDEIYFFVDFQSKLEGDARSEMNVGEVAYWPNGPAIAIFFGKTPASRGDKPMAASECNIIGKIDASPDELRKAKSGAKIILK